MDSKWLLSQMKGGKGLTTPYRGIKFIRYKWSLPYYILFLTVLLT